MVKFKNERKIMLTIERLIGYTIEEEEMIEGLRCVELMDDVASEIISREVTIGGVAVQLQVRKAAPFNYSKYLRGTWDIDLFVERRMTKGLLRKLAERLTRELNKPVFPNPARTCFEIILPDSDVRIHIPRHSRRRYERELPWIKRAIDTAERIEHSGITVNVQVPEDISVAKAKRAKHLYDAKNPGVDPVEGYKIMRELIKDGKEDEALQKVYEAKLDMFRHLDIYGWEDPFTQSSVARSKVMKDCYDLALLNQICGVEDDIILEAFSSR